MHQNFTDNAAIPASSEPICFLSIITSSSSYLEGCNPAVGEFIYAVEGRVDVMTDSHLYIACLEYGVWIPPGVRYRLSIGKDSRYASLLIPTNPEVAFPVTLSPIRLFPMGQAVLRSLINANPPLPYSPTVKKMLRLLAYQVTNASEAQNALTYSDDPHVVQALYYIEANLDQPVILEELAAQVNTTAKDLRERSRHDLRMSLTEWRHRLCVVRALHWLEEGRSVQTISGDLGYNTASEFIVMFRKFMHMTPSEFLKVGKK